MNPSSRVLVVDDDPRNVEIVCHLLEEVTGTVETASSGEQALEKLANFPADLILLDIMMPGMSGYDACCRIKADRPDVKVILLSAKAMVEERLKGYETGADDYIAKPFDHDEFLAKVRVFLKLRQAEQELKSVNQNLERLVSARTQELEITHRQLLQASKLASIGELATGIAHEINNPLTIVKGNLDFLRQALHQRGVPDLDPILDQQDGAVSRIVNIVNGLRVHARMDSGRMETVNLHRLIDESVTMVGQIFGRRNIKIEKQLEVDAPFARGNPGRFQQVIINLLSNAKDAIGEDREGVIRIETRNEGDRVVVRVRDNGPGVPKAIQGKIFDPFFTTKERGKGTGLGLSIVYSIVSEMNGRVSVESETGQGACFVLSFPRLAAAESVVSIEEPVPAKGASAETQDTKFTGSVLVVEDEEGILRIIEKYFSDFGFQVDHATDGIQALERLKQRSYDVLVTDIVMPRMRGDVLVGEAKRLGRLDNTRLIALSGRIPVAGDGTERWDRKAFHGFIAKPFSQKDVYAVLKSVL